MTPGLTTPGDAAPAASGTSALSSLVERVGSRSSPVVLCREHGTWHSTRNDFGVEVVELAAALSGYGLRVGGRAAILGTEGRGTLRAGLAVIAAGATLVPLDPRISDDALRRALSSTAAVQAIASDERQLSRILALRPDLPALELVLLSSAAPSERKPAALLVDAALPVGAANLTEDPELLRRTLAESEGGTACLVVDAAGDTSEVSRSTLLAMVELVARAVGIGPGKTLLLSLPIGGAQRIGAALAATGCGATLLLADPSERLDAGLAERPADALLVDVNGLERLHRAWIEDIESTSWLGRFVTRWALRQGRQLSPQGWKQRAAEILALKGLRDKLGGRATELSVMANSRGGASSEVEAFFKAAGLTIRDFSPHLVA